jgi:hypothetical protein
MKSWAQFTIGFVEPPWGHHPHVLWIVGFDQNIVPVSRMADNAGQGQAKKSAKRNVESFSLEKPVRATFLPLGAQFFLELEQHGT